MARIASSIDLIEVGFWAVSRGVTTADRPWPCDAVDAAWSAEAEAAVVAGYVERYGMVESFEPGYSWCRFGCAAPARELGCCTMTDGRFCWPEGFAHYIRCHSVRPPPAFIEHVLHAAAASGVCGAGVWPVRHELQWDPATQAAVPLPRGTRDFLARASTLHLLPSVAPAEPGVS